MSLKKNFFRLYYRRNVAKSIASLVCTNADATVTKAGASFNTEGAVDQLFIGMSVSLGGNDYRVLSITSDTEFELSANHDAGETVTGTFTTPKLSSMMGSELITEVDSYWKEFSKVEIGAKVSIEKSEDIQYSIGDKVVIEEKGIVEFNVLGFQEYSATTEGRFEELRIALNQKNVDILLFNHKANKPFAIGYYGIFGNVSIETPAGALPRIIINVDESESKFDESNIAPMQFTIETPVLDPDTGASTLSVTISCVTVDARMYMTINGDIPDEADTLVENYEVYSVTSLMTVKVKAFKVKMTASAVGSGTYT